MGLIPKIDEIIKGAGQLGMGLLTGGLDDLRQISQQKKLNAMNLEQAKAMQQLNLDTWRKTSYPAQVEMMNKAGLNVGLMYGGSGPGGQLGSASAPGSQAGPRDAGMGMQLALQRAQVQNIEADTEKKKVEAEKLKGVDTANVAADTTVKMHEAKLKELEAQLRAETLPDAMETIRNANDISEAQIRQTRAEADVSEETVNERIKQITQQSAIQALQIATQKQALKMNDQQMQKVATEIANIKFEQGVKIKQLNQKQYDQWIEERRTSIQAMVASFATGNLAQAKMVADILSGLVGAAGKAADASTPAK